MNTTLRNSLLVLASVAAFSVAAQTVTTAPRTITSQQQTPGVDSTFQGNVRPNAQTSTFRMTVTVTCTASSSSKTLTQSANCPSGYTTTAGASKFTQKKTQTTVTTCPKGAFGTASTKTTTGAWSPTPKAACTKAKEAAAPSAPINFETIIAGGYYYNMIKPGFGTCNPPDDTHRFNNSILMNLVNTSAHHYIVAISRLGHSATLTIPASSVYDYGSSTASGYRYQIATGLWSTAVTKQLTSDIDWSKYDYASAKRNSSGGITITDDARSATITIKACNSAGRCSAATTEKKLYIFSDGERDCQAAEGQATTYPATAVQ